MPGRTPPEAVRAFLKPLEDALAVLDGVANLTVSKKGQYRKGVEYSWTINNGAGMRLGSAGTFFASMRFKIIDADPVRHEAPLRVTARGYLYSLKAPNGDDIWRMHWHPGGASQEERPHLHIHPNLKQHQVSPRMTFEKAIQWCIPFGAPLTCSLEEALAHLEVAQAEHILYRSWADYPGEPRD